jgi:hypothetical protein
MIQFRWIDEKNPIERRRFMKRRISVFITLLLVFTLTACSIQLPGSATTQNVVQATTAASAETTENETTTAATTASSATAVAPLESGATHEDDSDYDWDSAEEAPIVLNGSSISTDAKGVTVDGSVATITAAGIYKISGSLEDGQIIVNTQDQDVVRLILSGVEIHSSTSAPIYIEQAKKVILVLADGTENTITDGSAYVFVDPTEDEPNAAVFSKADLTIYGSGSLTVNGNFNDGIASKDGLIIASGTVTVNAVDDGIRGRDYLVVKDGSLAVTAQGDALKSDNDEDAAKGFITVQGGALKLTSGADGIDAQTNVLIQDGKFEIVTGGGSAELVSEDASAKGIKGSAAVEIDQGVFSINAADDAIHSNGSISIHDGTFKITSADDGMHADSTLEINGGDIRITDSYEGIESEVITINAGNILVVSSDDGINGAGGNDGSGMGQGMDPGGAPQGGPGGGPGRGPGQDQFASSGSAHLYIHGGSIVVDANGDGVDINGSIEMTDGIMVVNGPTEQMNGALDYDAGFKMTGGYVVAAGSSGMAQAPDETSSIPSVMIFFDSTQPANSLVHIQDSHGKEILTFAPTKDYQSIAFASADLVEGATYTIYTGGSSTGAVKDGVYQGGSYSGGTQYTSFTVSGMTTTVGSGGGGFRRRP